MKKNLVTILKASAAVAAATGILAYASHKMPDVERYITDQIQNAYDNFAIEFYKFK